LCGTIRFQKPLLVSFSPSQINPLFFMDPRQKVTCGEAVVAMVFSIARRIVGKMRVVLPEHRYIKGSEGID